MASPCSPSMSIWCSPMQFCCYRNWQRVCGDLIISSARRRQECPPPVHRTLAQLSLISSILSTVSPTLDLVIAVIFIAPFFIFILWLYLALVFECTFCYFSQERILFLYSKRRVVPFAYLVRESTDIHVLR